MSVNTRVHHSISVEVDNRAISSASVVNLVTHLCSVAFQSIVIPKSLNKYPWELLRVSTSSPKAASEAPKKIGSNIAPESFSFRVPSGANTNVS
jgi:hypothetical protein